MDDLHQLITAQKVPMITFDETHEIELQILRRSESAIDVSPTLAEHLLGNFARVRHCKQPSKPNSVVKGGIRRVPG